MLQTISAEVFRQRLAGLEAPETRFSEDDIEKFRQLGIRLVLVMREVFGSSIDRKTLWERIASGMQVAQAKSGGKGERFLSAMLDYVKADVNVVVGSDWLTDIRADVRSLSLEDQRQFIRTCVDYRMLLCLEARALVQAEKTDPETIMKKPEKDIEIEVPINEWRAANHE